MQFQPTLPPEEVARANFYGLLARLFYAPPDATLLHTLAASADLQAEDDEGIGQVWRELAQACASADPEAVREEYDSNFVGVGKSPVTLYTSAYSIRFTNEAPLAALRAELLRLGIARRPQISEPEDHIAALCEVMRFLIAEKKEPLEVQKEFFERWIWPSVQPLCAAIEQSRRMPFYRRVADFLFRLCTVEHSAFEML
jgi:TorA maturation chaperone TorD